MTARLILFIAFLSLCAWILSLSSYKKYFSPENTLTVAQLDQQIEKRRASKNAASAGAEEAEVEKVDIAEIGKEIYTGRGNCVTCHGDNGQGNLAEEAPIIGGQHDWYILEQLQVMKAGERVNEKMQPYLDELNKDDFKALAAYISQLDPANSPQS